MTQTKTVELQAQDLKPGDFLLGSRSTIEWIRHGGLDIPAGKVRVKQIGRKHDKLWGKYTRMRVVRVID